MFCHQCGTKLLDGALFCSNCGTKVVTVENAPANNVVTQEQTVQGPCIPILGRTAQFDPTIALYLDIRSGFDALGQELVEEFLDTFPSRYPDLDRFVRDFQKDYHEILGVATNEMNDLLSHAEIYGVTHDEQLPYVERYCYHTFLVFQEIAEQHRAIVSRQEGMKEYRQERKDSRGRVVGGGFGVSGAMKGMATAGAVNLTTGALHSVGNAIGNIGSAISASNAKDKIYKSGIQYAIAEAIQSDILGMHLVTVEIFTARSGNQVCKYTDTDAQKAEKIRKDLEQGVFSQERKRNAVVQMLSAYPFSEKYYRLAVRLFPDKMGELLDFAKFFHIDLEQIYGDVKNTVDGAVDILSGCQRELNEILLDELDFEERELEPLTTDLPQALDYFAYIFEEMEETGFSFLVRSDEKARQKLKAAQSAYASLGEETPLLLYDSTLGRSGKSGFLITDKHVFLTDYSGPVKLKLYEAVENIRMQVDNSTTYLYFGNYKVHLLQDGGIIKAGVLVDILEIIIGLIIFLSTMQPEDSNLTTAITCYKKLPPAKVAPPKVAPPAQTTSKSARICHCFECGAENDAEDRFCCECGIELI